MVHVRLDLQLDLDKSEAKEVIDRTREYVRRAIQWRSQHVKGKWHIRGQAFDFYIQNPETESGIHEAIRGCDEPHGDKTKQDDSYERTV